MIFDNENITQDLADGLLPGSRQAGKYLPLFTNFYFRDASSDNGNAIRNLTTGKLSASVAL